MSFESLFRGLSSFLFMLLRFQFKAGFGILQSFILVTCPSHLYPVPNPKGPKPQSLPNPVTVSPHTKALYTACWLNVTEMTCRNWPATRRPSYTTRSLVTRVSVTTWLAAAKLGRLVLSQFVRCEHSRWNTRLHIWRSVQLVYLLWQNRNPNSSLLMIWQSHWRQPRWGCRGHIPQYFGWVDVNGNIPQYYYVLSGIADQYWLPSVRSASSRFHSAIRRHQFAFVRQADSRLTRLVPATLNSRWRHCHSRQLRSSSPHQLLVPPFRLTTVGRHTFQLLLQPIAIWHPIIPVSARLPSTS